MNAKELSQSKARTKVLSNVSDLDRLLRIMARWWDGWTWEQIAQEHDISRQRVGRLLARVGCTRALWRRADHRRGESRRQVLASQAAAARDVLLHRYTQRLTVRQRAALAWRAMGLGSVETARRMATTPTNVRSLLVAARWRLERLSRPRLRKRRRERIPRGDAARVAADPIAIEWQRLFFGASQSAPPKVDGPRCLRRKQGDRVATEGQSVARIRQRGLVATRANRGPQAAFCGVVGHWARRSAMVLPTTGG